MSVTAQRRRRGGVLATSGRLLSASGTCSLALLPVAGRGAAAGRRRGRGRCPGQGCRRAGTGGQAHDQGGYDGPAGQDDGDGGRPSLAGQASGVLGFGLGDPFHLHLTLAVRGGANLALAGLVLGLCLCLLLGLGLGLGHGEAGLGGPALPSVTLTPPTEAPITASRMWPSPRVSPSATPGGGAGIPAGRCGLLARRGLLSFKGIKHSLQLLDESGEKVGRRRMEDLQVDGPVAVDDAVA